MSNKLPKSVEFVRFQFVDIFGVPKNLEVPSTQYEDVLDNGLAFDGSSVEGFVRIQESDMRLVPDTDTLMIHPWDESTASVICDVYTTDGEPFEGCPRHILRKQLEKLRGTMCVGPEPEFFLLEDGVVHDQGGYFDLNPLDGGDRVRQHMVTTLSEMGFEIEAAHHEVAPGQHEIDFKYMEGLKTADHLIRFKSAIKEMALLHGYQATFMPKPFAKINGSGMHCHISLWHEDVNTFYDPNGQFNLSQEARYFIGGVLKHAKGLCALTNPLVNSYKRLVPGYEAPTNICWGGPNRSALIRVPAVQNPEKATRFEIRNPDPACNPYLALSAILAAGLDGIENEIDPPDAINDSLYEMDAVERSERGVDSVPATLSEAIDELEDDDLLCEVLGDHVVSKYVEAKRREVEDYRVNVTDWERNKYLKY